jgi:hypothetical protein
MTSYFSVPPLIPADTNVNTLSVDVIKSKTQISGLTKGSFNIVDGPGVPLTAAQMASRVLIKTGLVEGEVYTFPSPSDMATALGLFDPLDGDSYLNEVTIYADTNYSITIHRGLWTYLSDSLSDIQVNGFNALKLVYQISYTVADGWAISFFIASNFSNS